MKKKYGLYMSSVALLMGVCTNFVGCEQDERPFYDDNELPKKDAQSYTIGKESAEKDALIAAESFFANDGTQIKREVASVNALMGGENSRDTIAFVCNFKGDAGFAIIAADSRVVDKVVVCADEGHFSEDTDNPGFRDLLDHIKNYTERKIAAAVARSTKNSKGLKNTTADGDSLIPMSAKQVGPLIKTAWNQTAPYNAFLDTCPSGYPYYTGCTITALAQLIGYYNQPGIEMMPEMTAKKHAQELDDFHKTWVGILFRSLWRDLPKRFNGCAVGVLGYDALTYLQEYDYHTQGVSFYSSGSVLNSISEQHPVMVSSATASGGHTWLMDGYRIEQFRSASDSANVVEGDSYFHINWGWGGDCDGWFAAGCFDVDAAIEYDNKYHTNRNHKYMYGLDSFYAWPKPQAENQELDTEGLEK